MIPLTETIRDQIIRYLDYHLRCNAIIVKDGVIVEISPESKVSCADALVSLITEGQQNGNAIP